MLRRVSVSVTTNHWNYFQIETATEQQSEVVDAIIRTIGFINGFVRKKARM